MRSTKEAIETLVELYWSAHCNLTMEELGRAAAAIFAVKAALAGARAEARPRPPGPPDPPPRGGLPELRGVAEATSMIRSIRGEAEGAIRYLEELRVAVLPVAEENARLRAVLKSARAEAREACATECDEVAEWIASYGWDAHPATLCAAKIRDGGGS